MHRQGKAVLLVLISVASIGIPSIGNQPLFGQEQDQEIDELIRHLEADSFDSRKQAQDRLFEMGAKAVPRIVGILSDGSSSVNGKSAARNVLKRWLDEHHGDALLTFSNELKKFDQESLAADHPALYELIDSDTFVEAIKTHLNRRSEIDCRKNDVSLRKWEFSEAEARLLAMLPDMNEIYIWTAVPNEFFEILRTSSFQHLTIDPVSREAGEISTEMMNGILEMENLHTLELRSSKLSPGAVEAMSGSDKIKSVEYLVRDANDLRLIAQMPSLEELSIHGERYDQPWITAADFEPMKERNLKSIEFGFVSADPEVYASFSAFPNLSRIELLFPSERSLSEIIKHEQIVAYHAHLDPRNADTCIEVLSEAEHIKSLNLIFASITDVGADHLAEMTFLDSLLLHGSLMSKKGVELVQSKFDRRKVPFLREIRSITSEDSQSIHRLTNKGLACYLLGDIPQIYVFQDSWNGSDEELAEAMKLDDWRSFHFDVPLTDELITALLHEENQGRVFVVYDSGQHPDGAIERLRKNCEVKPLDDFPRSKFYESGDGDGLVVKPK